MTLRSTEGTSGLIYFSYRIRGQAAADDDVLFSESVEIVKSIESEKGMAIKMWF